MRETLGAFNRPWSGLPLDGAFRAMQEAGCREIGLMRHATAERKKECLVYGDLTEAETGSLSRRLASHGLRPVRRLFPVRASRPTRAT